MTHVARGRRPLVAGAVLLLALSSGTAASARPAAPALVRQDVPRATLLYQNFPNPFPTSASTTTCVWFDLKAEGEVRVDLFTLRGAHVRSLVPADGAPGRLPAGRYGRAGSSGIGCDGRFAWDGAGDDGRFAPAGVYLLRLRAGGTDSFRKVLFKGR